MGDRDAPSAEVSAALDSPPIARFVGRHPELAGAVADSLAAAAALRAARRRALPRDDRRVLAVHGDGFDEADRELEAAVEGLERLAPDGPAAEVSPAVERLARALAAVRLAGHGLGPARKTASPEARAGLFRALSAFHQAHQRLVAAAQATHAAAIPWQLELASHVDPARPVASMELDGYDLPHTPAAERLWGDRCFLSGLQFIADSHPQPAPRHRSLDSCHVLAPRYYRLLRRMREACAAIAPRLPEVVGRLARLAPAAFEEYAADRHHPTFARLGLLDFPSLAVSLNNLLRRYAERPVFGVRETDADGWCAAPAPRFHSLGVADRRAVAVEGAASGYVWQTYGDLRRQALGLARGLERLGLAPGARLGILATRNRPEFWLADFAALFAGLVTVGLQDTLADERLAAIVAESQLEAVVCDAPSLPRLTAPESLASGQRLRLLVVFGEAETRDAGEAPGPRVVGLRELLDGSLDGSLDGPRGPLEGTGSRVSASGVGLSTPILYDDAPGHAAAAAAGIRQDGEEDVYTLLYTSGSTGAPKGTIVTRRRWAEEMCLESNVWPNVRVSYQPPALGVDRVLVWRTLYTGGRVGFARRGAGLFEDARAVRPTVLDAPPVVWNTLYAEYKKALEDPSLTAREVHAVRRRLHDSLGGRLAMLATGGAPSDPGVRHAMEAIFGVRMVDNYGTTETGRIAVDGRLLPGLDYRLLPVPELSYGPDDSAANRAARRGELAVRTPQTTARYLRDDEATRGAFTADGYFRTGDIVEIGLDGRCDLIGRRKGFFKLAAGEFVSPELLERHYATSEAVEAVFVTGSPLEQAVVAVVVPSRGGVDPDGLLAELRAIGRRAGLRPGEIPAAVVVEPRAETGLPWTAENGLLTPSLKLNRQALTDRYRERVETAYRAAASARVPDAVPEASRGAATAAPRSVGGEAGARLRRIVASLLSLEEDEIELGRSFLELGGDSVTTMELMLRLDQLFVGKGDATGLGREASWVTEKPLAEVADWLAGRAGESDPPAVAPPATGTGAEPREIARTRAEPPSGVAAAWPVPPPAPGSPAAPPAGDPVALANEDAESLPLPEPIPEPSDGPHVLLTGGTGFLGIHLLHELAATLPPEVEIHVLVRAADDAAAAARVDAARSAARLPELEPAARRRVMARAGSLERPRLGLSEEVWNRLAEEIGLIYHVAAQVTFDGGYAELRAANAGGTRRVLELATARRLKALHFVSTLNVALLIERATGRPAAETSPLPPRLTAASAAGSLAYTLTKWAGERLVERLFEHCGGRWRASVSRPALISWSRATGVADPGNWLMRVLSSSLHIGCAIGSDEVGAPAWVPETEVSARGLDLVPVDFVARAVARLGELTHRGLLARGPEGAAPTPSFHVSNLAPGLAGLVTVPRLMDLLAAADLRRNGAARSLGFCPFSEWARRVEAKGAPAVPVLDQLQTMQLLKRTLAERFAAVMGLPGRPPIECPPVDLELVAAYVEGWYRDNPPARAAE